MRWLAGRAVQAGAELRCGVGFREARAVPGGFELGASLGRTRFLVGADGPRSNVARVLRLGRNRQFLAGLEHEYQGLSLSEPGFLHCFIDRQLMPGYIGWMVQGVHGVQVGLARSLRGSRSSDVKVAMAKMLVKVAGVADFRAWRPDSIRAGLIPCGGLVDPLAMPRALLVGDAAGLVSPVTAGGIHTALVHGLAAGRAVAEFLHGRGGDPQRSFVRSYPRFRLKRRCASPSIICSATGLQSGAGERPCAGPLAASTSASALAAPAVARAGAKAPCLIVQPTPHTGDG
jgi:flavin-dependent dehydrogenase